MGKVRIALEVLAVGLLTAATLSASGFENSSTGIKGRAMGGGFRALADDWTAACYNPAGYAFIVDDQLGGANSLLHHRNELIPAFEFNATADSTGIFNGRSIYNRHEILSMPSAGFVVRLPVAGETVFGLSAWQPFDNNVSWTLFRPLRAYNSNYATAALPTQYGNNLDVVAFQLTAARAYNEDKLAIGAGLQLLRGDLVFQNLSFRETPRSGPEADRPYSRIPELTRHDGNGWGFGLTAGALYKYNEKLNLAVTASLPFDLTITGNSGIQFIMPYIPTLLTDRDYTFGTVGYLFASGQQINLNAEFETKLKLPPSVAVGAAYEVTEKLTVALDLEYMLWSRFKGFEFSYGTFTGVSGALADPSVSGFFTTAPSVPADWNNAGKASLGASYLATASLLVMGGVTADQSAVDNGNLLIPQFIDSGDKVSLHLGGLYRINNWDLGVATSYAVHSDQTVNRLLDVDGDGQYDSFPGDYKAQTYETLFSISYRY